MRWMQEDVTRLLQDRLSSVNGNLPQVIEGTAELPCGCEACNILRYEQKSM